MGRIIGFDIDGTLVNCNAVDVVSKEQGRNFRGQDILDYHWRCFPKEFRERGMQLFVDPDFMKSVPIFPGVVEKLEELKAKGDRIVLITARDHRVEKATEEFVAEKLPMADALHVVGFLQPKKELFKKERLDVWVDDSSKDVKVSAALGIRTFLISNKHTRYNWSARFVKGVEIINNVGELPL